MFVGLSPLETSQRGEIRRAAQSGTMDVRTCGSRTYVGCFTKKLGGRRKRNIRAVSVIPSDRRIGGEEKEDAPDSPFFPSHLWFRTANEANRPPACNPEGPISHMEHRNHPTALPPKYKVRPGRGSGARRPGFTRTRHDSNERAGTTDLMRG